MAPFTTSLTIQHKDDTAQPAAPAIACPFPGCSAKIDSEREVLCPAHLPPAAKKDWNRDAATTNGARIVSLPTASPGAASQHFVSSPKSRKLLFSDSDKDRPIMRRRTAEAPFMSQQPTPKHSTPPSNGDLSMSPLSPPPAASHVAVHSPPASPALGLTSEPPRKRQKLSPPTMRCHEPKLNGESASGSSVPDADPGSKPTPSDALPNGQSGLNHTPQRQGKPRNPETKSGSKAKSKDTIREIPRGLFKLQFSMDRPRDDVPSVATHHSESGINGFKENVSPHSYGSPTSTPPKSATRTRTGHGPRPLRPLLPNGDRPDTTVVASIQPQTNGKIRPDRLGQTDSLRLRPPPRQIRTPEPAPREKEVDLSTFDALIYAQPGASTPPPELNLKPPAPQARASASVSPTTATQSTGPETATAKTEPQLERVFAHIDPRIHWPQPHSVAWHAAKQEEIRARGGRKANFGRAAHSLRAQNERLERMRREAGLEFEDTLPDKIRENPAWVRTLRRLKGLPPVVGGGRSEDEDEEMGGRRSSNGGGGGGGGGGGVPAAEGSRKGGGRSTRQSGYSAAGNGR